MCELEKKIVKWDILTSVALIDLVTEVNDFIASGWEPFGNITHSSGIHYQAAVKYEKTFFCPGVPVNPLSA